MSEVQALLVWVANLATSGVLGETVHRRRLRAGGDAVTPLSADRWKDVALSLAMAAALWACSRDAALAQGACLVAAVTNALYVALVLVRAGWRR